ncbi:hypothetical protein JXI42_08980 [bacterium]|nr:hypothetical protein [bacterium]
MYFRFNDQNDQVLFLVAAALGWGKRLKPCIVIVSPVCDVAFSMIMKTAPFK